jgi:hypothetical protein
MYRWLWTMAFLTGRTPAILVLTMAFLCLMYFTFISNQLGVGLGDVSKRPSSLSQPASSAPAGFVTMVTTDNTHLDRMTVWAIFILNIAVVGTVNGLYLWSTLVDLSSDVRVSIQFGVGLFSFVWSMVILRGGLSADLKESQSGVWLLTCLNIVNSVFIPCMVTTFSSPSCYQVVFSLCCSSWLLTSFLDAVASC